MKRYPTFYESVTIPKSELETLKAQLATQGTIITAQDTQVTQQNLELSQLRAQVRELRELIGVVIGVRRLPDILPLIVVERLEKAALRSAPPSGQDDDVDWAEISRDSMDYKPSSVSQAPFDKTNAWEERKDLAKVPAVSDGFTDAREIRENVRASPTADKSVEYSTPQDSPSRSPISIEVFQQDWMPGYAAFRNDGSLEDGAKAHVCLNLSSFLGGVQIGELTAPDLPYLIAESIMHEVIHVLESWANVEFSEERIEALLTKYRNKYHPEAPRYEMCEERQMPEKQAFGSSRPQTIFTQINHAEGVCSGCMNISYEFGDDEIHITCNQCGASVKTTVPLPAPPSPAPEKEKAE